MGQYWKVVNLDKREYFHPSRMGVGAKLWEQLANHPGAGAGLVILCASMPAARGGGELRVRGGGLEYDEIARRTIGRWAGDRVALVGDYAQNDDLPLRDEAATIYSRCTPDDRWEEALKSVPLESLAACADGSTWLYRDITSDVCAVIGHELDGKFTRERGYMGFRYDRDSDEEDG